MATDRSEDGQEIAGVIARPPLIHLGFLLFGLAVDWLYPAPFLPAAVQYALGAALFLAGLGIVATAFRQFSGAGTNIDTHRPTTALVTGGLYRVSRNPIYLALLSAYAGLALVFDSLWPLALAPLLVLVMRYGVIAREERYLEARFGDDYRAYCARVRRWL
jgi:protein-S-isoprenylcysteine O-methyltransferase Ste14